MISFRVGSDDAEILSKEFGNIISQNDLMGLSNWHAYLRLLIDGNVSAPFNIRTLLPERSIHPEIKEEILTLSRNRYGCHQEKVEAEIQKAWKVDENEDED